ncbi:MAG TPA: pyridoxal 5'-phosphate synthase glutaminase subunit PdxT [Thermoplasmata archaeon]|nr:pyridoxal 5'-phosphate synthase glutaminase subunit PdxT [Thermoplasmata archaeon]
MSRELLSQVPAFERSMRVGVVGVQGDVSEHVDAVRRAMEEEGLSGDAVTVRRPPDLAKVDALTIPGGESTTISKLLVKFELFDDILRRAEEGMPILGTCAGCILLAKEGDDQVSKTDTRLLGLMDMAVDRNAFGRQRESFEGEVDVTILDKPFRGVFIRAPEILRTWGRCSAIGTLQGRIVLAQQGRLVAAAFHPELSGDLRIHKWFLRLV